MWQLIYNMRMFIYVYLLNTMLTYQNMRHIYAEPKLIYFKSSALFNIITFPHSYISMLMNINFKSKRKKAKKRKKDLNLTLLELIFCILNQITVVGAIILQFVPRMPCEPVELKLNRRYGIFNFSVDTYNQKIPVCVISFLAFAECLSLLIVMLFYAIKNKNCGQKLGTKYIVGLIATCVLFLIGIGIIVHMLF